MSETRAEYVVAVQSWQPEPAVSQVLPVVCSCRVLSPDDAAKVRRCQAVAVLGCDGLVDVRMPADVWERVRGEGER